VAVPERLERGLCALATSRSPHRVLRKPRAAPRCAPGRRRCGGGAAPGPPQGRSPYGQEREQASNQPRRGRAKRLWAHGRSSTHEGPHGRARWPGCAQRDPGRRPAPLLPALRSGAKCPERTRPAVAPWNRPHGPADVPRPARLCPCRVCSLSGPDTFGPQACCGGTGLPLQPRPP
jgi:hypothetical protein